MSNFIKTLAQLDKVSAFEESVFGTKPIRYVIGNRQKQEDKNFKKKKARRKIAKNSKRKNRK